MKMFLITFKTDSKKGYDSVMIYRNKIEEAWGYRAEGVNGIISVEQV